MNSTPISAQITMNDSHLRGLIISYFRTPDETPNTEIGKRYATKIHKLEMEILCNIFKALKEIQDELFNSHNEICNPNEIYTDRDNEYPITDVIEYMKDSELDDIFGGFI